MADTAQAPTISIDDATQLVQAVDGGHASLNDVNDTGKLAYAIMKGQVTPDQLNPQGQAIYSALKPSQPQDHPVADTVQKTADLGALVAGGTMGAEAGAPLGPVGVVAGGVAGAGLAYAGMHQAGHGLKQMMGMEEGKSLFDEAKDYANNVIQGSKLQLYGEGLGAVVKSGAQAVIDYGPRIAKFLSDLPKTVSEKVLSNPQILETSKGTDQSVSSAVANVQTTLDKLRDTVRDQYATAMEDAAGVPKTDAAAYADKFEQGQGTKAPPLADIGKRFRELKEGIHDDLDPQWLLRQAEFLKQDINAHLKFYNSNVQLEPIPGKTVPGLQAMKTDVMNTMKGLPGGQQLLDASDNWGSMHDVYDSLQKTFQDSGKAVQTAKKVFTDDSTYYQSTRNALALMDSVTGKNVGKALEDEVTAYSAKQAMPENVMGKRQMIMAIAMFSPGRAITVPALAAIQSPSLMVKGMLAAEPAAAMVAKEAVPVVGGLGQAAPAIRQMAEPGVHSMLDTTAHMIGHTGAESLLDNMRGEQGNTP